MAAPFFPRKRPKPWSNTWVYSFKPDLWSLCRICWLHLQIYKDSNTLLLHPLAPLWSKPTKTTVSFQCSSWSDSSRVTSGQAHLFQVLTLASKVVHYLPSSPLWLHFLLVSPSLTLFVKLAPRMSLNTPGKHIRYLPTSGPLHVLFLLPRCPCPTCL